VLIFSPTWLWMVVCSVVCVCFVLGFVVWWCCFGLLCTIALLLI
jgi:hypothetical protein